MLDDLIGYWLLQAICFPIGWPIVKLATLGKYPSRGTWFSGKPEAQWTCATGLACLVITLMVILGQFIRS